MPYTGQAINAPINAAQITAGPPPPLREREVGEVAGYQWIEVDGGIGYGTALIVAQNVNVMANTVTLTGSTIMNIDAWHEWNAVYTLTNVTSATSAATCNVIQYGGWPFTSATTTGTINHYAWNVWNDRYDRIHEAGARAQEIQRYSRRKLSETELLAALEQEKKAREEAEKRAAEARNAEKRAEDLLRLCLSPQQIEDLEKKKCFYVEIEGKTGKKERYRIDRGSHGNVKQIDDKGSIIRSFCIQPSGVPVGDVLLTQKLWLEASEETREEFWATANITTLVREKDIPQTVPRKERRRYAEVHGLLH